MISVPLAPGSISHVASMIPVCHGSSEPIFRFLVPERYCHRSTDITTHVTHLPHVRPYDMAYVMTQVVDMGFIDM